MTADTSAPAPKKPSFFGHIKRSIKRTFRKPLRKQPRVRRISRNPATTSELVGPKGIPLGYFNMPKSGCSTIKNILYYLEKETWLANPLDIHLAVSRGKGLLLYEHFQKQRLALERKSPYFIFTFVRHPGRRVYSAFIEKILTKHNYALPSIRRHLLAKLVFTHQGRRILNDSEMPELKEMELEDLRANFKEFLRFVGFNVTHHTKFPQNPHWVSQAARLDSLPAHVKIDFVGKVENFAADFEHVLKQVGIDRPQLAHSRFNEGPKPPFRYEDVLDADLRVRLRALYAEDFRRFGYDLG